MFIGTDSSEVVCTVKFPVSRHPWEQNKSLFTIKEGCPVMEGLLLMECLHVAGTKRIAHLRVRCPFMGSYIGIYAVTKTSVLSEIEI